MNKPKLAFFSLAHSHSTILFDAISKSGAFDIIGFAEVTNPPCDVQNYEARRKVFLDGGCKEFLNYKELANEKPDVAIINSTNHHHEEIAIYLMKQGINVVVEKPLSVDVKGAKKMIKTAKENGVFLLTNWPIAWFPPFRLAKKILDSGRIGKLMKVTYRSPATWGPFADIIGESAQTSWWLEKDMGGGSILDYACYGSILGAFMFDKAPVSVQGLTKKFATKNFNVEDYSAMMIDYGDGVGLLEGSWATYNCGEVPSGPVLHGTKGTIVCDRYSQIVKIFDGKSKIPVPPTEVIDAGTTKQDEEFGKHLAKVLAGEEKPDIMLDTELNLWAVATYDAGRKSAKTGKAIKIKI